MVPDKDISLSQGAIAPWAETASPYYQQALKALADHYKKSPDLPWSKLGKKVQQIILYLSLIHI